MSKGFRQSQSTLHTWSGLLLGWVLFIIFVAGTAAYWREALNRWMRPETPRVEQPMAALAQAQRFLERKAPGAKTWFVTVPTPDMPGTQVFWVPQPDPGAPKGERRRRRETSALIDATGAPVARETRGGEFFYRFHFDLHYMPVIWARWLVSVAAMLMLIAILSGIVTHKKIFRDFFTLRRAKGQRSWLDGHNASAVLGLPFHLMITYTGLVSLSAMLMPWAVTANYADPTRYFADYMFPLPPAVERTGRPAPLPDLSALIRDGERRLGAPIGFVAVTEPGDAAARITLTRASSAAAIVTHGEQLTFNTAGRVVWRSAQFDGARATFGAMIGLHAGRFGDTALRWLYFLCGIGGTLMVTSGLVLWTVKRREKLPDPARPPLGFRLVERLNVAVVAGFPLACVALFWANRLLPLGRAARAEGEISWMFAAWGAAAIAALVMKPKAGWLALLFATAVAAAGLVVHDLVMRPGLIDWVATGDRTLMLVEAVLLMLAAGIGWAGYRVARHQPRIKPMNRSGRGAQVGSLSPLEAAE